MTHDACRKINDTSTSPWRFKLRTDQGLLFTSASASSKKLAWRNRQIRSLDVLMCGIPMTLFLRGRTEKTWHVFRKTILHRCFLVLKQKRRRSTELSVACERAWKAMRSLTPSLDCSGGFINRDLPPRAIGHQNYTSYSGSAWERPARCTLFLIIYFT